MIEDIIEKKKLFTNEYKHLNLRVGYTKDKLIVNSYCKEELHLIPTSYRGYEVDVLFIKPRKSCKDCNC